MAARSKRSAGTLEAKLVRIADIRRRAEATAAGELRSFLADDAPFAVARAAQTIEELRLDTLASELIATFQRLASGDQPDSGCTAALAVLTALAHLEVDAPDTYLAGTRLVRIDRTPVGQSDRAVAVRIEAARALVATGFPHALLELVPLLADPETEVRAGVAEAVGALGSPAAAAVLHLKLLASDEKLDVRLACMTALLRCIPSRFLPIVGGYLGDADEGIAEIAALALGEWREAAALPFLTHALEGRRATRFTASALLAIASLRTDEGPEYLLGVLENGKPPIARQALDALAVHAHVEPIAARVRAIVERRGLTLLREGLGRFGA